MEKGGGDRPEGREALGWGGIYPAEGLCFSLPLSGPSYRPELQGNYGNAALKPSIAFFQFLLGTKKKQHKVLMPPPP